MATAGVEVVRYRTFFRNIPNWELVGIKVYFIVVRNTHA